MPEKNGAVTDSSSESSSVTHSSSGGTKGKVSRIASSPAAQLDLESDVSDAESAHWGEDTLPPPKEGGHVVRIRRHREEHVEWDARTNPQLIALYGRRGFNRRINGVYRRHSEGVYKKESDPNEVYLFQSESSWRLAPSLDSESSFGYVSDTAAPNRTLCEWQIFNENGSFEGDLNIKVRSLPDSDAASKFLVARHRKLSSREKALIATLANRGVDARSIAEKLLLNEEACKVMVAAAANRHYRREEKTESKIADSLYRMTSRTEDEVAFAVQTTITTHEQERMCDYVIPEI